MILFRYALKEYLKLVMGTVILCVFLFVLFDFIHKTTNYFARYNPSPLLIAKFYLFQLPFQLVQIFPIASLLASVITMVFLNRSNEITAMRAAGMTPFAIAFPLFCGGCILTLLSYGLGELVVPYSAQKMHYITKVLIEGDAAHSLGEGVHWVREEQKIFNFKDFDHTTQTLKEIKLITLAHGFLPKTVFQARQGHYLPEQNLWQLEEVKKISLRPNGTVSAFEDIPELNLALPVEPKKLNVERRLPDEWALSELGERIASGSQRGLDILSLRIAWHVKIAYPLATLLISLLGLKFGYRSERTTETVKSVLLAFAVGISYWFVLSAARALAGAGDVPPFLAGWLANFMISMVVGWQFWRVCRA